MRDAGWGMGDAPGGLGGAADAARAGTAPPPTRPSPARPASRVPRPPRRPSPHPSCAGIWVGSPKRGYISGVARSYANEPSVSRMTRSNAQKTSPPHRERAQRSASQDSPPRADRPPRRTRRSRSAAGASSAAEPAVATTQPGSNGRNSRNGRSGRSTKAVEQASRNAASQLTSVPTHRGAYNETRRWLLEQHGAVCAYCARAGNPREMTLDHVTPRRGQTAYDRRDNLVLACRECNAIKADKAILAFLLARRERAATLLRYGAHLSPMLIDLAKQIAGPEATARAERMADPDYPYSD